MKWARYSYVPEAPTEGLRDVKLSKVTRPVRSKALDLRLSVSKAPVSRQRRAERGQGQQRDKMTKMETTEKDRGVLDEGRAGSTAGVGPGSSLRPPPAGLVLAPSPCL